MVSTMNELMRTAVNDAAMNDAFDAAALGFPKGWDFMPVVRQINACSRANLSRRHRLQPAKLNGDSTIMDWHINEAIVSFNKALS